MLCDKGCERVCAEALREDVRKGGGWLGCALDCAKGYKGGGAMDLQQRTSVYNVHKVVQTRKGSMLLALAMLYPFGVLLGGVLLWDYLSPNDLLGNYPPLIIVGTGLAFGFLVSLLYLPLAIANTLTARLNDGIPLVDEHWVLLGYCAYTGECLTYAEFN
ncbi:aminoalcoholphosphotransferase [Actinidia rufa]|uniref:Aminoalcoholphosphotransferase n=1 Tax=Actinidia rufa TaxID=165716 RepID=A0A7J0F6X2_9ERIC|nr:aminoalcoholphosphotransferase [Actinidia rufa]